MTHGCSTSVPPGVGERHVDAADESPQVRDNAKFALVAEADRNRTCQRRGTPLSGFEDQEDHQEPRRLRYPAYMSYVTKK